MAKCLQIVKSLAVGAGKTKWSQMLKTELVGMSSRTCARERKAQLTEALVKLLQRFLTPVFFFRPTPDGSRQVVYQAGKTIALCKFTELIQWQQS